MHPSKRKGDAAELEVQELLRTILGLPGVRRMLGAGRADDVGDIDGVPNTTIQVANYANIADALNRKLLECPQQQLRAGNRFGATFIRRRGARWFVALTPEQFAALWKAANQSTVNPNK